MAYENNNKLESAIMEGNKGKDESNDELNRAIVEGNTEQLEQCLKSQTIDVNRVIGENSYLDIAIKSQNLEVIRLLLESNAVVPASLVPSFNDANKEIIKLLLAHTDDVEKTDSNRVTYLHLAVKSNLPDIVELLLGKGVNIYAKTVSKQTALHMAFQEKNMTMILLLNRHMNLDPRDGEEETALHLAVNSQDLSIVKLVAQQDGTRINASNKFGLTSLHLAIFKKQLDIVQYLIKSGADVNFATKDKRVPLHMAAECGSVEMVKILLENGAVVNRKTEFGITPLHTAVFTRRKEIVELFVNAKADVNAVGERDETPLNIAVAHECEDIVKILISHGAIVNHGDKKDMLLHMAAFNKSINMVKLLLEHNADVTVVYKNDRTALHMAAEQKCPEIVEMLLKKGADIDAKTDDGFTALHISVEYNDLETCQILLQHKANIDLEDKKGRTPLCFAAEQGYVKMVQQILSFKPDSHKNKLAFYYAVKDNDTSHKTVILELIAHGYSMDLLKVWPEIYIDTFMANAVRNGHTGIVEYLLKHGYDANKPLPQAVEDTNFGSLLHLAVRKRQLQNAQLLIEFGSDINIVDEVGHRPIFYAVENNYFQMTKLLLDNKAVLDDSHQLLFMAARENNFRLIREILKYYKNVNVEDEFGTTALHFATWHGNEETVQLLLEKGAKCKTVDQSRQICFDSELYTKIRVIYGEEAMEEFKKNVLTTPLHIAARKNCSDIAEAILESGLSVNCRDGCGRTPLHVATLFNNIGPMHLFMEFNADLYAQDHDGYTCIDYACNNNQFIGNMHMDKVFPFVNRLVPIINTIENCQTASELAIKYLAVAHARNEKSCVKPSSCSRKLEQFYDNCMNEIGLLNSTKIVNGITCGHVLINSIDTVTSYLRNSEFVKAFECVMDAENFPLYKIILKKKMRRAKERRLLLDEAQIYFTDILCLPDPPANRIMDFLYTRDLGCIKQTYESFHSQFGHRKCKES